MRLGAVEIIRQIMHPVFLLFQRPGQAIKGSFPLAPGLNSFQLQSWLLEENTSSAIGRSTSGRQR